MSKLKYQLIPIQAIQSDLNNNRDNC
ncbi:hypothetical protein Gotur_024474 [Gossypium turneri]